MSARAQTFPAPRPGALRRRGCRRGVGLLLLGTALLAACGQGADQARGPAASHRGGTAVLGSVSDVDSWNEYVSRQSFAGDVLRRIYLRLASERGDGTRDAPPGFAAQLAESWTFSEDRRELTFRLIDAVWSDGEPIDAEDVRFTWQAQTAEAVPWINAGTKSRIVDVVVVDPRNVTFRFDGAYPNQLSDAVEGGILPQHVFSRVPFEQWATHTWSSAEVASGPFVLERHEPGQQIVLRRNDRYHGESALLDRVVIRVVPDIGNLVTQLRTGAVDYVEGIPPRDAAGLKDSDGITLIAFDYPSYDYIGWNGSRPPFDDGEMRLAMSLAIDRQALVDDLLYGFGRVSVGPLLSFWWAADPTLEAWPYDPERARRILRARGYEVREDNGEIRPGRRKLQIELLTNAGNRLREDVLVKVQEQLKRVGVEAALRPMEMRAMRQQAASGDYDGYLGSWVYTVFDLETIFHSRSVFPHGGNVVFYRSAETDAVLERLEQATEGSEMLGDLHALQQQIHHDQPYTFLYEKKRLAAHGARLSGVSIDVPADPLANLERFWVRD